MWLWNVADPRSPALIAALTGPTGHVYALGLSPDSALLAAGGADSTTRIWTLDPATAVSEICANVATRSRRPSGAASSPERRTNTHAEPLNR